MVGQSRAAAPEPDEALTGLVARLRAELEGIRRAMRNRAVIEQAKGVLVERLGVGPDAAFEHLVQLSQRANIKLAEVAAALVGTTAPDPTVPATPHIIDDELREYIDRLQSTSARPAQRGTTTAESAKRPPAPARPPALEALQSQHQLVAARISSANSYQEIADAVADTSTGWAEPSVVVLTLLEPDGALRLVASHGLSAATRSQWGRIPPHLDVPLVATAHRRTPVWLPDAEAIGTRFPIMTGLPYKLTSLASLPVIHDDRAMGALGIAWAAEQGFTDESRRYLLALAGECGRRVRELQQAEATGDETVGGPVPIDEAWLPILLETLLDPATLLAPVYDGDRVVDFRFQHANAAVRQIAEAERVELAETSLLALFPDIGSRVLLPKLVAVLDHGESIHMDEVYVDAEREGTRGSYVLTLHASRLWDRVLGVWRVHSPADLLHEQLLQAERIARVGSFWWNLRTGELRWSPEQYRLFGRDPRKGALPFTEAGQYVHEDDWLAYQDAVRGALLHGRDFSVEFRFAGDASGRRLRTTGEPLLDESGEVWALRGTVQDVTEERAVEARLRRAQEALAAQRQRLESERHAAEAVQQALLPTAPELATTEGLTVDGLCRTAARDGMVAGDWYDVLGLPDGTVLLVVGDVAGSGLPATIAATRLRNATRAYAVLGMSPAQLLGALNVMLGQLDPEHLATMVVATFDPEQRLLRWAAAGQAAPMRYLPDRPGQVLSGPLGLPVGAAPAIGYDEAKIELEPGARLLLYTNGLLARRDATLADGLEILISAPDHIDVNDPEVLVEHVTNRLGSLPDDDLCVIIAGVAGLTSAIPGAGGTPPAADLAPSWPAAPTGR